ncbi:serine/threonine-protein kinase [Halalkalibacter alkaliphilus]|uniref:non-specific serine/threonine protein kinase n=1 Tax=Halalkalibacter alkaliphilus TaxID=2917993 RepID=A0A9X2CTY1_9BACI|nr:serine/threonine-protein kinase [Halalkalibacter alkaliphilus]MCL7748022.1 protein kinase [Halalkalibacter alkaliphilus]
MIKINEVLDGKYRIIEILGKGGMGSVFLAENMKVGNLWAIKAIDLSYNTEVNLLAEPEMLKKLNHPNLPRIVDIIHEGQYLYIVEDYFEGETLQDLIKDSDWCTESNIIKWAKQLCDILIYLHNMNPAIIYRDMKPGNIIIDTEMNARLIDFGVAREYKEGQSTDTTLIGTKGYAAPEQYGTNQTDARTDIYSLGVTLYHAITGKGPNEPPYELVPVRQLNKNLSEGIETILLKCTRNDPEDRYQSAEELLDALENIHKLNKAYKQSRLKRKLIIAGVSIGILGGAFAVNEVMLLQASEKAEQYQAYLEEGFNYYNEENYDAAEEAFLNAQELNETGELFLNQAKVFLARNENERVTEYLQAKVINEGILQDNNEVHYLMGTAFFNLGDYEKSIWYFNEALKDNTGSLGNNLVNVYRDLAVSYGRVSDYDKAEEILAQLTAENDTDHVSHYVKGELMIIQQRYDEALAELIRANQLESGNTRFMMSLANVYLRMIRQGNAENTEEYYQKAIELLVNTEQLDPNNITVLNLSGQTYYDFGLYLENRNQDNQAQVMFESATASFSKLLDLGINDINVLINQGILYDKLNKMQQAEEYYKRALEQNENHSRGNLVYGLFLLKKQEYNLAHTHFQKTIDINDNPGEVSVAQERITELREKGWIN